MYKRNDLLHYVQVIYAFAIPLLLLAFFIEKPFVIGNIKASSSALIAPLVAFLFLILVEKYPLWLPELCKTSLIVVITSYTFIKVFTHWPIAANSPIDDLTWTSVLHNITIENILHLSMILSLPIMYTKVWSSYTQHTLKNLFYTTIDTLLRSVLLYGILAYYKIQSNAKNQAYIALGNIFWWTLITPLLALFTCLLWQYTKSEKVMHDHNKKINKQDALYGHLLSLFLAILLLTNIVSVRYITIGPWIVTAGVLTYPFTFLFTDIISELYSRKQAQQVIHTGLVASLWIGVCIALLTLLIGHEAIDTAFSAFFTLTPGLIIGSMIAYTLSQWADVQLFHTLKHATNGRYLWLRNNIGTIVSQGIDTFTCGIVAWKIWPQLSANAPVGVAIWSQVVRNEYMCKIIIALLDTPLLYITLYFIRRLWQRK